MSVHATHHFDPWTPHRRDGALEMATCRGCGYEQQRGARGTVHDLLLELPCGEDVADTAVPASKRKRGPMTFWGPGTLAWPLGHDADGVAYHVKIPTGPRDEADYEVFQQAARIPSDSVVPV